ncbi:hypothetical protein RHGRI_019826 [Rhododendron griersonianum]|uniref:Uncharacterized protein n=1 Tax=Rhododendron griersonianum TaxID=479676 RepID=A0AAV6JG87_9ERIC|nr:hypothetical protein RHGRI_019826 [Rhododendron griersonianum]
MAGSRPFLTAADTNQLAIARKPNHHQLRRQIGSIKTHHSSATSTCKTNKPTGHACTSKKPVRSEEEGENEEGKPNPIGEGNGRGKNKESPNRTGRGSQKRGVDWNKKGTADRGGRGHQKGEPIDCPATEEDKKDLHACPAREGSGSDGGPNYAETDLQKQRVTFSSSWGAGVLICVLGTNQCHLTVNNGSWNNI